MSDKTYYLFAGLARAGEVPSKSFQERDAEGLWRRLTSDATELYGEPYEESRSSFQLFTHFQADNFFVQLIVDFGTNDWPRNMVPASLRIAHAEDAEAFAHALYDHLDGRGYYLALEENDSWFVRCNYTDVFEF
ncbi:hypothetical protein ACFWUQ_08640 [Streptomyces sp. NPDC058662]|uniref:hypothetical protein n=1 Tax=Streptomyces sp. NPDC058662 TaxID=3346583 RepID=UPI00364BBADD